MSARLATRSIAKPWGRDALPAPFTAPPGERIGEVWFEPAVEMPQLLVKYIFTSDKLSVQVHLSDAELQGRGKEECWLVLDAEPGAKLGIGFREALSCEAVRAAALDGSIEALLVWHDARPGEFFYIPAGTVHAIGGGVSLIEVQQNSDVTWRLYDYGRPREIHLDEALKVARCAPHDPALRRHLPDRSSVALVDGPHFRLDRIDGLPDATTLARYGDAPVLVLPQAGEVRIGGEAIGHGGCGVAASLASVDFDSAGLSLIAQPSTP